VCIEPHVGKVICRGLGEYPYRGEENVKPIQVLAHLAPDLVWLAFCGSFSIGINGQNSSAPSSLQLMQHKCTRKVRTEEGQCRDPRPLVSTNSTQDLHQGFLHYRRFDAKISIDVLHMFEIFITKLARSREFARRLFLQDL
jgi:hypothetical protein